MKRMARWTLLPFFVLGLHIRNRPARYFQLHHRRPRGHADKHDIGALAAIHVFQVSESAWPRPLPMGITHSTVSPHRSVDATGRALPMTVEEIHAQAVEIARGLDALDDMGDEHEQSRGRPSMRS
jgi:hypothetical protein